MTYRLPEALDIGGTSYPIRWDTAAALDIITALSDPDLDNAEKAQVLLHILYTRPIPRARQEEALKKGLIFLDGGREQSGKKAPRVVDWNQDFAIICPAVNRVLGYDIRQAPEKLHWWTFLSAYMEIGGDCLFSQVISIREKQRRGKKLEKWEQDFARRNPDLVNLHDAKSAAEKDMLAEQFGIQI